MMYREYQREQINGKVIRMEMVGIVSSYDEVAARLKGLEWEHSLNGDATTWHNNLHTSVCRGTWEIHTIFSPIRGKKTLKANSTERV